MSHAFDRATPIDIIIDLSSYVGQDGMCPTLLFLFSPTNQDMVVPRARANAHPHHGDRLVSASTFGFTRRGNRKKYAYKVTAVVQPCHLCDTVAVAAAAAAVHRFTLSCQ